jgi:hypothetical protein
MSDGRGALPPFVPKAIHPTADEAAIVSRLREVPPEADLLAVADARLRFGQMTYRDGRTVVVSSWNGAHDPGMVLLARVAAKAEEMGFEIVGADLQDRGWAIRLKYPAKTGAVARKDLLHRIAHAAFALRRVTQGLPPL